jgi:hypothetical protein
MTRREMLERMNACPKWGGCNAPVCPLYDEWAKCSMQSDESVCFYLSEYVKDGAEARFQAAGLNHIHRRIGEVLPEIVDAYGRIRRALDRSAVTGARMARKIGQ